MYIMICDRCGAVQKFKSILQDPQPGRKYSLVQLDEFREITLCQNCDAALGEWIEAPAADVVGVRHGRWKGAGFGDYYCIRAERVQSWHYCPNCGAKMDGGPDK